MADRWLIIEGMVEELGELCAIEVEVAGFPEIHDEPAVREVRLALIRATAAMSQVGPGAAEPVLVQARSVLDDAVTAAAMARRLVAHARAARNSRS